MACQRPRVIRSRFGRVEKVLVHLTELTVEWTFASHQGRWNFVACQRSRVICSRVVLVVGVEKVLVHLTE